MANNKILKKGLVVGITILFIGVCVVPSTSITVVKKSKPLFSNGNTLYAGGDGPGNYSSIQDAIDNSSDGDTVFVYDDSSPYYENVVVNKSINLIGEDRDTTIIDGNWSGDVVYVLADWVNISGFTIQKCGSNLWKDAGIDIDSQYNIINDNNILFNMIGIFCLEFSKNTIIDNIITSNFDGIYLHMSYNNTVINNTISLNYGYGLIIQLDSNSNTITGNIISNNCQGIILEFESNNNIITGNTITNNEDGIIFSLASSNNAFMGNIISSNIHRGIYIGEISNSNTITGNSISNNEDGIMLQDESNSNTIVGNTIFNNIYSIRLRWDSNNNIICHNNFLDNGEGTYDECDNIWDDGKYGNFWDDYKDRYPNATKKWLKCIWDTPYEIPGGDNKDRCPLINKWSNLKPKTISRNTVSDSSYLFRLLERYPMLNRLLSFKRMI